MKIQSDLFGHAGDTEECTDTQTEMVSPSGEPIAAPCGFLDRASSPCRRLASRPVMMDGRQLICRGTPIIHCEPECFNGLAARSEPMLMEESHD